MGKAQAPKVGAHSLYYDHRNGWNPPNRVQEERAWGQIVKKEKQIMQKHENERRDKRNASAVRAPSAVKWPGGPGFAEPSRAPFFEDATIWKKEIRRRDSPGSDDKGLQRMETLELVHLKRKAEEELEKRQWDQALNRLNTMQLADLSDALGSHLETRQRKTVSSKEYRRSGGY